MYVYAMCIYIYIYICICICRHIYIYIFTYMYLCAYVFLPGDGAFLSDPQLEDTAAGVVGDGSYYYE